MNAKEFFDKVAQMREYQKQYFRTRAQGYLLKSKELEAQIHKEIERVKQATQPQQQKLF